MVPLRLLLLSVQWTMALAATGLDMCYGGSNSICDAYLEVTCGTLDVNNTRPYYECGCGRRLPLKQACDECNYEYGVDKTMADNWYSTSLCSSMSIEIGTIPAGILSQVSEHTATITLAKSKTFDSASYLSSQRVKATSTAVTETEGRLGYDEYTTTYGGSGQYVAPIETAPPSVPDTDSSPGNLGSRRGVDAVVWSGCFVVIVLILG